MFKAFVSLLSGQASYFKQHCTRQNKLSKNEDSCLTMRSVYVLHSAGFELMNAKV